MDIDAIVWDEWRERHMLGPPSLAWLVTHADPSDPHPIATAIECLRTGGLVPRHW